MYNAHRGRVYEYETTREKRMKLPTVEEFKELPLKSQTQLFRKYPERFAGLYEKPSKKRHYIACPNPNCKNCNVKIERHRFLEHFARSKNKECGAALEKLLSADDKYGDLCKVLHDLQHDPEPRIDQRLPKLQTVHSLFLQLIAEMTEKEKKI